MTTELYLLGAGHQAGLIIDLIAEIRAVSGDYPHRVARLYDDACAGEEKHGFTVGGTIAEGIAAALKDGAAVIVAIGDRHGAKRYHYFKECENAGLEIANVIHPAASIAPSAKLGRNLVIFPLARIARGVALGDCITIFSNVVIEHDSAVGDNVIIAPGVSLSGAVKIGGHAFLGVGSSIQPGIAIGDGALVAGGAAVAEDAPPFGVVGGVPAKILRETGPGMCLPCREELAELGF